MSKEKECLTQPEQTEQEPVAWMNNSGGCFLSDGNKYSENWTALYTTPPKREPLSFEDLNIMWCGNPIDFARRIESIHGIGDE